MTLTECDIFEVGSRKWKICRNEAGLSLSKTNAYRVKWNFDPIPGEDSVSTQKVDEQPIPEFVFHGHSVGDESDVIRNKLYGPGTELLRIYEAAGVPSCDACKELAQKMNNWGVEECRKRLEEIFADIFPRAKEWLNQKHPWAMKLIPNAYGDRKISRRIRADITKSIDEAERLIAERRVKKLNIYTGEKIRGCSGCSGSAEVKPRVKNRAANNPFLMGKAYPRFITIEQYARDVRSLLEKIPHDVDCVAGVARSGLYPASMVAMWLHKPMIIVSQSSGDIVEAGNGWRLGRGHNHVTPKTDRVLVVDDTVMTGGSQQIIRRVVGQRYREVIYATVYCNPAASLGKPDIHAVDLEWPHLLEWNLFNSVISQSTAVDFDGILCHDCPIDADDDGAKYLDFLQNAKPLYLPRKEPLPLIVTARIEKYREPTERWLDHHGVKYEKLVMHPAKSTREREKDDIAAYKAKHFDAWASKHVPAPGPVMFIESADRQARRIAKLTNRLVLCPATAGVYRGDQE